MSQGMTPKQKAERQRIALAASWEIDALVRHLNATLPTEMDEYAHVRAMAIRIRHLNSVAMSVLDGDHGRTTEALHDVLEGVA